MKYLYGNKLKEFLQVKKEYFKKYPLEEPVATKKKVNKNVKVEMPKKKKVFNNTSVYVNDDVDES